MKYFLKIVSSEWVPGGNEQMIHTDEQGRKFVGPPLKFNPDRSVVVEVSSGPLEDGYKHILKVITGS